LQKPVYTDGDFGQLEVPQTFQYKGKWYMTFCTAAEHWSENYRRKNQQGPVTGSHYLIADHHLGPWRVAPLQFLDGHNPCKRYAGKIIERSGKLFILGFLYYDENGKFTGQVSDPIELSVDAAGLLHFKT
jgi:beta-fructofuranosidase